MVSHELNLYRLAAKHKLSHAIALEGDDLNYISKCAAEIIQHSLCAAPGIQPCGICSNCIKVLRQSHPDVKIISEKGTSNHVKIEDIRFIREDAHKVSNEGSYKFYIINHADSLTAQAQNAVIKILEEPPVNVIFIFLCRSSLNLLPTIRSRVQIFEINNFSDQNEEKADLAERLADEIVKASVKSDKCRIIEIASQIPSDRLLAKKILEDITEGLIKTSCRESPGKSAAEIEKFVKKIESLQRLIKSADKNVNFNLLICNLCASL